MDEILPASAEAYYESSKDRSPAPLPTEKNPGFPLPRHKLREAILKKAGLTVDVLSEAIAKAFHRNVQLLDATKEHYLQVDGGEIVKREVADNLARQRAVEALYDIGGVIPKDEAKVASGPTIVLQLPDYYDPKFVEQTSPKVINADCRTDADAPAGTD